MAGDHAARPASRSARSRPAERAWASKSSAKDGKRRSSSVAAKWATSAPRTRRSPIRTDWWPGVWPGVSSSSIEPSPSRSWSPSTSSTRGRRARSRAGRRSCARIVASSWPPLPLAPLHDDRDRRRQQRQAARVVEVQVGQHDPRERVETSICSAMLRSCSSCHERRLRRRSAPPVSRDGVRVQAGVDEDRARCRSRSGRPGSGSAAAPSGSSPWRQTTAGEEIQPTFSISTRIVASLCSLGARRNYQTVSRFTIRCMTDGRVARGEATRERAPARGARAVRRARLRAHLDRGGARGLGRRPRARSTTTSPARPRCSTPCSSRWSPSSPTTAVARRASAGADALENLRAGARSWMRMALDPAVQRIYLLDPQAVVGWARWRELDERYWLGGLRASFAKLAAEGRVPAGQEQLLAYMLLRRPDRGGAVHRLRRGPARARARRPKPRSRPCSTGSSRRLGRRPARRSSRPLGGARSLSPGAAARARAKAGLRRPRCVSIP